MQARACQCYTCAPCAAIEIDNENVGSVVLFPFNPVWKSLVSHKADAGWLQIIKFQHEPNYLTLLFLILLSYIGPMRSLLAIYLFTYFSISLFAIPYYAWDVPGFFVPYG